MSGNFYFLILHGALLTVIVSMAALVVSVLFGLLAAAAKLSSNRFFIGLAQCYTTLVRGVPDLILMLLIFYGGTIAINRIIELLLHFPIFRAWTGWGADKSVDIEPLTAGIITIGFIYGAYMAETFRGAILSIPKGQMEAAWSLGMGKFRTFARITFPQMVRYALPGFTNNWLVLIKATALVSLIGLADMTYLAKQAGSATRSPFQYFMFTALLYLVYTSASLLVLKGINKRYSLGVKRGGI